MRKKNKIKILIVLLLLLITTGCTTTLFGDELHKVHLQQDQLRFDQRGTYLQHS